MLFVRYLWKIGRNVNCMVKKVQTGMNKVEEWGRRQGFRLSGEKTKNVFFTRKEDREKYPTDTLWK